MWGRAPSILADHESSRRWRHLNDALSFVASGGSQTIDIATEDALTLQGPASRLTLGLMPG